MKLYVIRHGQTKCNVEKKYNGRYDEDINEEGIKQAKIEFTHF
jgi:broad specificity phosphatase PhoE